MVETILAVIASARQLSDLAMRLTELGKDSGAISDDELDSIRERMEDSNSRFDEALRLARERLNSEGT